MEVILARKPYKKNCDIEINDFLASEKSIISIKEARKILGKEISDKISDEDLTGLIKMINKMANNFINDNLVPKDTMVV